MRLGLVGFGERELEPLHSMEPPNQRRKRFLEENQPRNQQSPKNWQEESQVEERHPGEADLQEAAGWLQLPRGVIPTQRLHAWRRACLRTVEPVALGR